MIKTKDIKRMALTKGMNLRQLAIKANIPYNTLYIAIQRNSKISAENMEKIEYALNHPFDEFDEKDKRYDSKLLSENENIIIDIYRAFVYEAKRKKIPEERIFEAISDCLIYNSKSLFELAKEKK